MISDFAPASCARKEFVGSLCSGVRVPRVENHKPGSITIHHIYSLILEPNVTLTLLEIIGNWL
jgi:hypothetical protein